MATLTSMYEHIAYLSIQGAGPKREDVAHTPNWQVNCTFAKHL